SGFITISQEISPLRAVSIDNLDSGAVLGKTIFSQDGRVLLKRGAELSTKAIATLARLGYQYIYVSDDRTGDIEQPDLVSEELRAQATNTVREAFQNVATAQTDSRFSRTGLNFDAISDVAGNLVDQILNNPDISIQMVDLKSYDAYTFQHSVNVAVMGVVLGKSMKLNFSELKDLAIGLLLHDLGNVTIPEAILKKPTKLTDEEFKYVYEHPRSGFELLRQAERISAPAKIVALQHHEKLNGTGYPKGLKGADIHINSQIGAIVDAYDALTSDRNYRKRYLPHEAIEYLMGAGDTHYAHNLVKNFVSQVAPYPPGTMLKLSTGDVAVVTKVDMTMSTRPQVRLLFDKEGRDYPAGEEIELAKYQTVTVTQVLPE
ncbi:MAG: HD-GYP domain-containing protein, partial [Candidatus Sericytochromatia bacterium]